MSVIVGIIGKVTKGNGCKNDSTSMKFMFNDKCKVTAHVFAFAAVNSC